MDISGVYYCSKCMLQMEEEGSCPHCGHDPGRAELRRECLEENTFLNDRYLLGAMIGSGGFGITYAAWDTLLETPVAIKEYFPRDIAGRDVRDGDEVIPGERHGAEYALGLRRFMQEARVLAMFRQVPGIVNVSDCFEENGTFYFVMEYVRGISLDAYVKAHRPDTKRLLAMMRSTIDALEAVHAQGILHRDITPKNLMVLADGSVKLIDFGSARKIDREGTSVIVTEHYAPVEQYDSRSQQGPWTDIYSLCATIYEMITGIAPQESLARRHRDEMKTPSALGASLKKYQEHALMAGLAVEPERRIRSMAELRARLYNLPLPEEIIRRKSFIRRVCAISALVLALCAVLAVNFTKGLPLYRGLMLSLFPDGWHITGCRIAEEEYSIPESCMGIPISAVKSGAFADADALRRLEIPGSIPQIGAQAFFGCERLEHIVVHEGVKQIENYALAQNPALRELQLPESLEYMSPNALSGASKRLRIWGERGSYAEEYAYTGGDAEARESKERDYAADGDARLYTGEIPFLCREDFTVEAMDGGMKISDCIPDETSLVFPDFIDGEPVVALQEGMLSEAEYASLRYICLPSELQVLPNLKLQDECFDDAQLTDAKVYDLGKKLLEIGDNAFCASGLEEIILPEGLEILGKGAFSGSGRLKTIVLPDSLKEIREGAFANTGNLKEITLPDTMFSLNPHAFMGSSIEGIRIPDQITEIPEGAFEFCAELKEADLPPAVESIGANAFFSCRQLRYLEIPAGLRSIGEMAFYNCNSLHTLRFMGACDNLSIGKEAFSSCSSMEYICLPDGARSIGAYAFSSCTALKVIHIPPSVTEIADTAFADCRRGLVISGSAGSYAEAFAAENGMRFENESAWIAAENASVYENSDGMPVAAALSFAQSDAGEEAVLASFYDGVPIVEMMEATSLPVSAERIAMPLLLESFVSDDAPACEEIIFRSELEAFALWMDDYESMDSKARSITSIIFEDGDEDFILHENSFSGTGVQNLHLPENLEYVDHEAFACCPDLEEVVFPASIESMDARCFRDCPSLKSIVLPEGDIDPCCMFAGCSGLETVVLPESVDTLDICTFAGCSALKDVWILSRNLTLADTIDASYSHYTLEKYYNPDFEADYNADWEASIRNTLQSNLVHPFSDCRDVVIHGYEGSAVETLCREWGLIFEPVQEDN